MNYTATSTSAKVIARIAGISLIFMALIAGFGYGYGFESLYQTDDAMATIANLNESRWLFRMVMVSFIVILILDIVIAWCLYVLFKTTHELLSKSTAILRLIYTAILEAAIFHLSYAGYLMERTPQKPHDIMNCLNQFLSTWSFGLIFFGSHLISLGFLLKRARVVPSLFSLLAHLAGICYILTSASKLLFASIYAPYQQVADGVLALPMAMGELALAFWLICNGARMDIHKQ